MTKARNLNLGEAVTVKIHHFDGCAIKVLNPEVLRAVKRRSAALTSGVS